jgi:hypothetical protein
VSRFEPPGPPAAPGSPPAGGPPLAGSQASSRTPWGWLLAASAAALVVGMVLGFALGSQRPQREPAAATAPPPAATRPIPATPATVRSVASPACLETASRGDEIIDLFVKNQRSRAVDLLEAYTIASRQCRRDASP